jgi:hypothetical protein
VNATRASAVAKCRVERHRALEQPPCLDVVLAREPVAVLQAELIEAPRLEVLGAALPRALGLGTIEVAHEGRRDGGADLVLEGEQVRDLAIIGLGPDVLAGGCVDQLRRDADAIAGAAHAAFHHVTSAELGAHPLQVAVAAAVLEARVARDHREGAPGGEPRDQIFGEAVGEEGLLGVGREVVERQHRDRRPTIEARDGERIARGPVRAAGRRMLGCARILRRARPH